MKLWIDAKNPAPEEDWAWCKTIESAKIFITSTTKEIVLISICDNVKNAQELIDWLNQEYPLSFHKDMEKIKSATSYYHFNFYSLYHEMIDEGKILPPIYEMADMLFKDWSEDSSSSLSYALSLTLGDENDKEYNELILLIKDFLAYNYIIYEDKIFIDI